MTHAGGYDARALGNYLLDAAKSQRLELTHLQLQKIIFFAHCIFLRRHDAPLVLNRFEAWEHGPVVPELYHALKKHGDRSISGFIERFDLETGSSVRVIAAFPRCVEEHLAEVLAFYGRLSTWELLKLAHAPGGAWDRTIRASKASANFAMVIENSIILESWALAESH